MADQPQVKILDKALRVLMLFTPEQPEWGVTAIARSVDMPKSTVHRILRVFEQHGFLTQDADTRRFRLGLAGIELGRRAQEGLELRRIALPVMEQISALSGETVLLQVLSPEGDQVVCIERVQQRSGLRLILEVGATAPDFHAVDLATGDSVTLHQRYQGKVTLVNIWATWCEPCKIEMPAMEQVYRALAPRGFAVAAVSIDEGSPDDVRAFGQQLGLSFDLLQDRSTRIQQIYQTTGVPESFLLNRQGVIVKRIIGAHDWNSPANRALVERLLAEPGP